jgi:nucleoside phosphorylase
LIHLPINKEVDMTSSNTSSTRRSKAVIVTALRLEYRAVRAYLSDTRKEVFKGTNYECGTFSIDKQAWEICLVEIGKGNPTAAFETERAINYFEPDVVLFVGVAGGLAEKDVNIGDVVCVTRVYSYDSGKADVTFQVRPISWSTTYDLEQSAKFEARTTDWLQLLNKVGHSIPSSFPEVHVAPIAAGEKVIASTETEFYRFLRNYYNDAVAVEMEAVGFLQAIHANSSIKAMVIRGISDLIDKKTQDADKANQPKAAQHASAFAFQMLAKLNLSNQGDAQTSKPLPITTTQSQTTPMNSFELFFSYVEKDQRYVDELQTHLTLLKKRKVITDWYGSKLAAGDDPTESMKHLNQASVILLLISPDYIALERDVDRAMERKTQEGIRVIPIRVRPADWEGTSFSSLQAIPRNGRAISEHSNLDQAFYQVATEIREVIEAVKKERGLNS